MHPEALLDDVGNRHARRQRAVGVLEHDLHVVAERPHLPEVQPGDLAAEKHDRPIRRDQPQDGEPERGLAGAGFADDAQRLALAHRDAHAVDRLDVADDLAQHAALDREPDLQVLRLDHDRGAVAQRRRVGLRLGGEQRPGIGVLRRREDALDRSLLDDLALLHHAEPVGELAHDPEVVGDEQHRHAEPGLQFLQQAQDLRLHGDVERGGRFVGNQQIGLVGERHGDHHALALAAGKLVRIAAGAASRARGCRPGSADRRCARAPPARSAPGAGAGFRRSASRWCGAD